MGLEEINTQKYTFKRISSVDIASIEDFSCGLESLDEKLTQMKNNDEGTTLVFFDEGKQKIIGYCTYATSGLTLTYGGDVVTRSAVEIKYFAIHKTYQHREFDTYFNFSDYMLNSVIRHLIDISEQIIAFEYILLHATPDAEHFYLRNGFKNFSEYMMKNSYGYIDGCIPMFFEL